MHMYDKDFYKNATIIYSDNMFVLYERDYSLHLDVWSDGTECPESTFTSNCPEYNNNISYLPYNDKGNILQFISFCASKLMFPYITAKLLEIGLKIYNSNIE